METKFYTVTLKENGKPTVRENKQIPSFFSKSKKNKYNINFNRIFIGLAIVLATFITFIHIQTNALGAETQADTAVPVVYSVPTEVPSAETKASVTVTATPVTKIYENCPLSAEIQQYAYEECQKNGIPFDIFVSLMYHESTYREKVVSSDGSSIGLCQINKCNLKALANIGVTNLRDPKQNIKAGTYILGQHLKKYNDIHLALMCYNFGEGGAKKCWNDGKYSSKYSRNIVKYASENFRR